MINDQDIARRLATLEHVGVGPGGVVRMAWTAEDAACREWFEAQAGELGLAVRRDPAGNLWACPAGEPPWWAVGSHLDSVRGGGRFDGPLGVACGFEVAASSQRPVAVVSFADEEGARFNTPTFGSKALAGRLDLPAVLERRDDHGARLLDAIRDAAIDPDRISDATEWVALLAGFIEIHIDQSTDVARAGVPVGIVSSLSSRRRLEVVLRGRADHAGTTPRRQRSDALAAAARLIVGADELSVELDPEPDQAGGGPGRVPGSREAAGLTVTTSRILAEPNAPTTIAARVRLWIDARAVEESTIDNWQRRVERFARELAARSDVGIEIAVASSSAGRAFSERVRHALSGASEALLGRPAPDVVCFAGHDAGVLAEEIPAGMVLVRNASGVSHSPLETVELADAAVAARVVETALRTLAGDAI